MDTHKFLYKSSDKVTFRINNKTYTVDASVPADTSLNTYIRNYAHLTGTKNMCHEGGCGACIVSVTQKHIVTETPVTIAVNSCLVPVFSCHGWDIFTVEGIGNKVDGFNKVQKTLAKFNGTQCGYCSPGMVMNMFSLLEGKSGNVTMKEVENSFGGNICRCTGYRPILDAFKSLCVDAPPELAKMSADIEDLNKNRKCLLSAKNCEKRCGNACSKELSNAVCDSVYLAENGSQWFRVTTTKDVFEILSKVGNVPYMLVGGNTGNGVYRRKEDPKVFIDMMGIKELREISQDPTLRIGACVTLTELMDYFNTISSQTQYSYTNILADHIDLIASVPVRNIGTIAGNLSLKHQHNEFPSDLFLMMETAGATLNILQKDGTISNVSLVNFLKMDMKSKIIHSLSLPKLEGSYAMKTYKIMPRAQNAHAYVNAGFMFKLKDDGSGLVTEKPVIVFGGINPKFVHASKTETFLNGKVLLDSNVFNAALKILNDELDLDHILPDATPEYRKGLALSLFYKFALSVYPNKVNPRFLSGGKLLERPVSSAKQTFQTDETVWPVNKPVPKIEAMIQCTGEAKYANDLPSIPGELFGAFVLTRVGQGNIAGIDSSEALAMPGVIKFFTAEDIPGKNNFMPVNILGSVEEEEVFCSGKILHAGQVVGLIVAESQSLANTAADKVKLSYNDVKKPILTIRQAIKENAYSRITIQSEDKPKTIASNDVTHVVKGSFDVPSQYHYTMETQTCVTVPTEDGLDIYPASQWMDAIQRGVMEVLNIPENKINIVVRRVGGAYGCKISRSTQVANACALAAYVLNKPVRVVLKLESNMESMGKRMAAASDYEVGVNDEGKIQYLKMDFYSNYGSSMNEGIVEEAKRHMKSCYDDSTWSVMGKAVKTDIASNTYCRAPGSTEATGIVENIMEHISHVVGKDPVDVRLQNLSDTAKPAITELINDIKVSSDYESRKKKVNEFNEQNRWKKRGISLVVLGYPFGYFGGFYAMVSIYADDGTVAVSHGGIECGQGVNTKVAQVCAHILNIPLESVTVKPANNLTSPNGMVTGGSIASEACCYATIKCCQELLKRLEPIKSSLKSPTWQQLVREAYLKFVDLCATYMFTTNDDVKPYNIWGVAVAEVEVDILTGQHEILRTDIIEDAGKSLSPEVDVGQVEGAFVMGLGMWLTEELIYNPISGELLTNRTWNYKPPGAKDIPSNFNIELRKNAPNPFGVLRSKATGEPPLCMSCVVFFAIKNALNAARLDAGGSKEWFQLDGPATVEKTFMNGMTSWEQYSF